MALHVKDADVDRLADRLAALQRVSKTEAVRRALTHDLERIEGAPSLVLKGVAFCAALRSRSAIGAGRSSDKAFIDGLYDRSDVG